MDVFMSFTQITSVIGLTLKRPFSCQHTSVQKHPLPQLNPTGRLETQQCSDKGQAPVTLKPSKLIQYLWREAGVEEIRLSLSLSVFFSLCYAAKLFPF